MTNLCYLKILLIISVILGLLIIFKSLQKQRKKIYKPRIKFNNGNGAILCNKCSVIIKENLTKEEFEGKTDLLFCDKCLEKNKI